MRLPIGLRRTDCREIKGLKEFFGLAENRNQGTSHILHFVANSSSKSKFTKVAIIGLGYVGLPLAVEFADAGCQVVALDTDPEKVSALNNHQSYIEDIPSARLASLRGRVQATADFKQLASCKAVIICVPTPLTNSRAPDLTYLIAAAEGLAEVICPGQLVVLSTQKKNSRKGWRRLIK